MKTYTVTLLYLDEPVCEGKAHTYMTSVEASSPIRAAKLAAMGCETETAVVSVIEGDHEDLYPYFS